MAESVSVPVPSREPAFISYLMSPDLDHDCYFIVGNTDLGQAKTIGAVKKMLLAHSVVLRAELQDSKMAEKGPVSVADIYPDTFNHLLRFVYGYDTTSSMTFDEADNLLYAAEKYLMDSLKARLSVRLMALLTPDNVCSLLNNPACFRVLELDSAITQILQYETDIVFASAPFLSLSPDALVKILEQDIMNVSEIDVWKAAFKWAKHNTGSEEGHILRKQLTKHIKHLRICTLSLEELAEVAQLDVVSGKEFTSVLPYLAQRKEEIRPNMIDFSNTIEPRTKSLHQSEIVFPKTTFNSKYTQSTLTILTKECAIELLPMNFTANSHGLSIVPTGLTYQCECTILVAEITDYFNNTSAVIPKTVTFSQLVEYGKSFVVPVTCNSSNVRLMPNKKYTITVTFNQSHSMPLYNIMDLSNEHLTLNIKKMPGDNYFTSPIKSLLYRPFIIRRS